MPDEVVVYTCGHSNTPASVLFDMLRAAGIETLVDIRRYPASRRHPQFNAAKLAATLAENGIDYLHAEALGGRREPVPGSPNGAIRDEALRGYADHAATPEFEDALQQLLGLAASRHTAVMCAEGRPENCHRSLLADCLVARGAGVVHLVGGEQRRHALSAVASVEDGRVTYPSLV